MQNARLYALTASVVIGTCLSSLVTDTWYSAVFLCLGFVSTTLVSWIFLRWIKIGSVKHSVFIGLFLICFFGAAVGCARVVVWMSFNHKGVLDDLVNKKVSVSGVVIEEPQVSDSSSKIIIKTIPEKAKVLLTADRYSNLKYGDEVKVFGKMMIPKPIKSDEGDFAYDTYLARQGIFYTMIFPNIKISAQHQSNILREYLIDIKNIFLGKINQLFVTPKSGLLAGLLVSGRSSLSKSEQTMFTQAGLIHIVALSGFNVTIIAQGLMAILIFLPKKLRLIVGALGIISFVTMAGFGSTIVRAGIMALLVIMAALVYKNYNVGRALFIAVLAMVLWNPMVVFDVSFQLSCIATFAVIFAVGPAVSNYSKYMKFLPEKFKIRETILGTAVIEIFLLPILLSTSGQISLVTVITNLLILPILPFVMGVGFLATIVGFVHSFIALPFVVLSNIMLGYILIVTQYFSNIPYGVFSFRINEWMVLLMYVGIIFWLYKMQKTKGVESSDSTPSILTSTTALTSANLERLDNFFRSHSN